MKALSLFAPSRRSASAWIAPFFRAAFLLFLVCSSSLAGDRARVLVLHSYHHGYEWTDDIMDGIRAAVRQGELPAELHVEYLDSRRRGGTAYHNAFAAFFRSKYAQVSFAAIVVSDDNAFRYLLSRRDRLFPGVPIVFCGINHYGVPGDYLGASEGIREFATGVLETIDVQDTANIALQLHPHTKYVYLVGEPDDQRYDLLLGRQHPLIEFRRIRTHSLSLPEIERQLRQLPPASVVLLSAFSRDVNYRQLSMAESVRLVSSLSPVPVYGFNKIAVGQGIVGGRVTDGFPQGYEAAKLAQRLIAGAAPRDLPLQLESLNPYLFDYRQLKRWGISESALPSGSRIAGKPRTFYQQYRTVIWAAALFTLGQGFAIALLLTSWIRQRKSERALARSQRELARQVKDFETLLRVIPVGIAVAEDPQCQRIRTNPAFSRRLGVPENPGALVTRPPDQLPFRFFRNGQELSEAELPMQVAAREGREVRDFELDLMRADGHISHEFGHASPLFNERGELRGSLGVFVDITEWKRAEAALQESESRFRHLADAMPQIVWTARPDGTIDYFNLRWSQFTGRSEHENYDDGWSSALHPEDRERCHQTWLACLHSGEVYQAECRFWHSGSRRYRWQLSRAVPVHDTLRGIVKWFGTCTDIEDQKQTEEALRRANVDLEQFAYSASHDLQEPLRNLRIYSQLLGSRYSDQLDSTANEFLGHIIEGSERIQLLVRGLLQYSQIATPPEEPTALIDANAILQTVLEKLRPKIEQCQGSVAAAPLPPLRMHETHLRQLLSNLIDNSLTYRSEAPPSIHLSALQEDSQILISIQDNGIGISPEYQQRIFGIFKRLHTRVKYQGVGIGLAICQRIVERYHGVIWVESELGTGATFRIRLPLQTTAPPAE